MILLTVVVLNSSLNDTSIEETFSVLSVCPTVFLFSLSDGGGYFIYSFISYGFIEVMKVNHYLGEI